MRIIVSNDRRRTRTVICVLNFRSYFYDNASAYTFRFFFFSFPRRPENSLYVKHYFYYYYFNTARPFMRLEFWYCVNFIFIC